MRRRYLTGSLKGIEGLVDPFEPIVLGGSSLRVRTLSSEGCGSTRSKLEARKWLLRLVSTARITDVGVYAIGAVSASSGTAFLAPGVRELRVLSVFMMFTLGTIGHKAPSLPPGTPRARSGTLGSKGDLAAMEALLGDGDGE